MATHYRPDCDYIDGRAVPRNVGLYPHSSTVTILACSLYELTRGTDLRTLMSVRTRVNESTILVPDVSIIRKTSQREDIIITPPLLIAEVLSPEDTLSHLQWRVDTYAAMDVKHIWAIDPWNAGPGTPQRAASSSPLTAIFGSPEHLSPSISPSCSPNSTRTSRSSAGDFLHCVAWLSSPWLSIKARFIPAP